MAPILSRSLTVFAALLSSLPGSLAQNSTSLNLTLVTTNLTTVDIYYAPPQYLTNGTRLEYYIAPQQKRISYSDANGLAIIDGDIILTTVSDIEASTVHPGQIKARGLSIPHNDAVRKWTNGVLYYKYESQDLKDEKKEAFDLALKLWSDRLPQIYFQEDGPPNPDNVENGGTITLRGSHAAPEYCKTCSFSPVGRAGWFDSAGNWHYSKEANQMILGPCYSVESCAGVYAHELGHSELMVFFQD